MKEQGKTQNWTIEVLSSTRAHAGSPWKCTWAWLYLKCLVGDQRLLTINRYKGKINPMKNHYKRLGNNFSVYCIFTKEFLRGCKVFLFSSSSSSSSTPNLVDEKRRWSGVFLSASSLVIIAFAIHLAENCYKGVH